MSLNCCHLLPGNLRNFSSPFARIIALDYYDGPTEGIVECSTCGTLFWFSKLDWDDGQDVRIFSLAPIKGLAMDIFGKDVLDTAFRTRSVWMLMGESYLSAKAAIKSLQAASAPVEYVVATENLLDSILSWKKVGSEPFKSLDWFKDMQLSRRGKD